MSACLLSLPMSFSGELHAMVGNALVDFPILVPFRLRMTHQNNHLPCMRRSTSRERGKDARKQLTRGLPMIDAWSLYGMSGGGVACRPGSTKQTEDRRETLALCAQRDLPSQLLKPRWIWRGDDEDLEKGKDQVRAREGST